MCVFLEWHHCFMNLQRAMNLLLSWGVQVDELIELFGALWTRLLSVVVKIVSFVFGILWYVVLFHFILLISTQPCVLVLSYVYICTFATHVHVWWFDSWYLKMQKGQEILSTKGLENGHKKPITSLCLSADKSHFLTGSLDLSAKVIIKWTK